MSCSCDPALQVRLRSAIPNGANSELLNTSFA